MKRQLFGIGAALLIALASSSIHFIVMAQSTVLEGRITANTTLTPNREYTLNGIVFVDPGVTLTILPGTTIKGGDRSALVIERGAKLMAEGTPTAPIIFTSAKAPGSRTPRDWGGVWINGRAPINVPGGEDLGEAGLTGVYGGGLNPDPNDNSGVIRYVRIEFAGFPVAPDRELNNFTLAGVGAGTTIDHIHVNRGGDDGVEFFGGTVNVKYVLITGPGDDGFDWQTGYTGKAQFVVVQQDAEVDVAADRGIEADNNEQDNELLPRSNPILYNFTIVGDPRPGLAGGAGVVLRRGTAGRLRNMIVIGFKRAGIDVQGSSSQAQLSSGQLTVNNSIVFGNSPNFASGATANTLAPLNAQVDPQLVDPFTLGNPDFRPRETSPAKNPMMIANPPNDGFFSPVNFIGGVDPENDWTKAQWVRINLS